MGSHHLRIIGTALNEPWANDLAHGIKSFEEVWPDNTIEKLLEIKNEVIEYLRQILENVKTYLDNQEYLDVNTNNP